ncbi:hypothetical protein BVRB_6g144450 [Beta vulgaris subsp. vulgaris]|nr:hypothetical protein BVRB_6g144450 [Beta vulgaris subsp. vulgaris]
MMMKAHLHSRNAILKTILKMRTLTLFKWRSITVQEQRIHISFKQERFRKLNSESIQTHKRSST